MSLKGVVVVSPAASPTPSAAIPATHLVANRAIVCHAVDALTAAEITEIAVVGPAAVLAQVGNCLESPGSSGACLTYLPQPDGTGLATGLQAAARFVGDDPAVAHFAEGLLGEPVDHFTPALTDDATDLLVLLHHSDRDRDRLAPATQRLLGVAELDGTRAHLALAGVCLFGPGVMRRAAQTARELDPSPELLTIAEALRADGCLVEARFAHTWRSYDGDPRDLLELNRLVLDQQVASENHIDQSDNRIEGRVVIHPTAHVSSSTIFGPAIIGARAWISDAYIGPYTAIGAGARIEGAEIVRSIVAEDARVMHVGGRIEGSTIGPRATIFRDFNLPRAMRLHVGAGVEVALD